LLGGVEQQLLKRIATAAVGAVLVGTRAAEVELSNPCGTMKSSLSRLAECCLLKIVEGLIKNHLLWSLDNKMDRLWFSKFQVFLIRIP